MKQAQVMEGGAREEEVDEEEDCNTSLALAIGGGRQSFPRSRNSSSATTLQFHALFPHHRRDLKVERESTSREEEEGEEEEEEEVEQQNSNYGGVTGGGSRKKLKLTKEQVSLLEDSFRDHNTLNMSQKKDLAERLNIQPRQVEVWFQNRRARTKLKKIEVDSECLKRWCERLSDENRRLKEELQELKSNGSPPPLHVQQLLRAATLAVCPSCERMCGGGGDARRSTRVNWRCP